MVHTHVHRFEDQRDVVLLGDGGGTTQAGRDVRVLEADDQVGGYMQSESRDGFILEKGPFNVIVRDPNFETLLEDLASDVNVVSASKNARLRFIFR